MEEENELMTNIFLKPSVLLKHMNHLPEEFRKYVKECFEERDQLIQVDVLFDTSNIEWQNDSFSHYFGIERFPDYLINFEVGNIRYDTTKEEDLSILSKEIEEKIEEQKGDLCIELQNIIACV